jgi:hypothetical protein
MEVRPASSLFTEVSFHDDALKILADLFARSSAILAPTLTRLAVFRVCAQPIHLTGERVKAELKLTSEEGIPLHFGVTKCQ